MTPPPPPPPPPPTPPDRPWPPFPAKPRKSTTAPEQAQPPAPSAADVPAVSAPAPGTQPLTPPEPEQPRVPPRSHVRPSRTLPRDRTAAPIGDLEMDAEKSAALRDVMEYAARVTRAIALARPLESIPARPLWLALFAIISLAFGSYVYLARPDWVLGPAAARTITQERAHLRFAMYLAAQHVEASRDSITGALPASLLEIGEEWPGVDYETNGSTFRLSARDASGETIEYESTGDLVAFVAGARPYLRDTTLAPAAAGVAP